MKTLLTYMMTILIFYGLEAQHIDVTTQSGTAVKGKSSNGRGLYGEGTVDGVYGEGIGRSASGVYGYSKEYIGVYGKGDIYGIYGTSDNIGIYGFNQNGTAIYARNYEQESNQFPSSALIARSTWGAAIEARSTNNYGIIAQSSNPSSYAGYFLGRTYISGKLNIGLHSTDGYKLDIVNVDATPMRIARNGNNGGVIDIHNDGSYVGGIKVNGGTVSYNNFTGSHIANSSENFNYGELVSLDGKNGVLSALENAEIIYGIQKSSIANDPSVLGAYFDLMDDVPSASLNNLHTIMAVGNGSVWVVDNGPNIEIGDYLISSATSGHAMKDLGNRPVSHIVGRAVESVDWSEVDEIIDGKRHKLISITFEQFDIHNNEARLKKLEEINAALESRLDRIESIMLSVTDAKIHK